MYVVLVCQYLDIGFSGGRAVDESGESVITGWKTVWFMAPFGDWWYKRVFFGWRGVGASIDVGNFQLVLSIMMELVTLRQKLL